MAQPPSSSHHHDTHSSSHSQFLAQYQEQQVEHPPRDRHREHFLPVSAKSRSRKTQPPAKTIRSTPIGSDASSLTSAKPRSVTSHPSEGPASRFSHPAHHSSPSQRSEVSPPHHLPASRSAHSNPVSSNVQLRSYSRPLDPATLPTPSTACSKSVILPTISARRTVAGRTDVRLSPIPQSDVSTDLSTQSNDLFYSLPSSPVASSVTVSAANVQRIPPPGIGRPPTPPSSTDSTPSLKSRPVAREIPRTVERMQADTKATTVKRNHSFRQARAGEATAELIPTNDSAPRRGGERPLDRALSPPPTKNTDSFRVSELLVETRAIPTNSQLRAGESPLTALARQSSLKYAQHRNSGETPVEVRANANPTNGTASFRPGESPAEARPLHPNNAGPGPYRPPGGEPPASARNFSAPVNGTGFYRPPGQPLSNGNGQIRPPGQPPAFRPYPTPIANDSGSFRPGEPPIFRSSSYQPYLDNGSKRMSKLRTAPPGVTPTLHPKVTEYRQQLQKQKGLVSEIAFGDDLGRDVRIKIHKAFSTVEPFAIMDYEYTGVLQNQSYISLKDLSEDLEGLLMKWYPELLPRPTSTHPPPTPELKETESGQTLRATDTLPKTPGRFSRLFCTR